MKSKKHNICINAEKVYDWVMRPVEVQPISITNADLAELTAGLYDATEYDNFCQFLTANHPCYTTKCRVLEDTLYTQEITQSHGRQKVEVTLPNGETVTLYRVKILAKGQMEIAVMDDDDCFTLNEPVEFFTIQTLYLCAPKGTCVEACIVEGECDAEFVCTENFQQLDISVSLCLDVFVTDFVKIEVEAAYCHPRNELPINDVVCGTKKRPPNCDVIFPGMTKDY
ncbi:hypothetical protein AJ85_16660 [Alkalihalobacillus alcalophilus ATCC 27647 = CGMCC 1.3604]|nr:hypothetical protein [Alkalihalobacillus alcalophilus]MED1562513.1 hypothetical protein [Alkalihalobacillus alcalophilus]THG92148.1 hypothetical protein AJ85_16660 [Alkalihalobacillus alcalophilus ATCC 27647 = CGMCC 1.3604]